MKKEGRGSLSNRNLKTGLQLYYMIYNIAVDKRRDKWYNFSM